MCAKEYLIFGIVIPIATIVAAKVPIRNLKRTEMLELIVKDVGNIPPNFNDDKPTNILCEMSVNSFDSINEANMDFTVGVLIHLRWYDPRFITWASASENGTQSYIEFDSKHVGSLWVPDLFFPNEKDAFFHNVFMTNKMLRVYPGGWVSYTSRLSMTLSCPMNLRNYPFDEQRCSIEMESFSYDVGNIILNWIGNGNYSKLFKGTAVETRSEDGKDIEMPQFALTKITTEEYTRKRKGSGIHSGLRAHFHLERNVGYYVVQMYIPSILVVMLSWISFWLNVQAVPGRIALGVLTVLTMTTQSSGVNASLPRVSYTKAIDIWMSVCLLFVFAALIEFALANVLSRKDSPKELTFRNVIHKIRGTTRRRKPKTEIYIGEDGEMRLPVSADPTLNEERKKMNGILYAMYLDVCCRILFPVLFAVFNIVYWTHFLTVEEKFDDF